MSATTNGAPRGRRVRRRTGDGDWLSLVEPVGQFLTAPILRSAFPAGLPAVPAELRAEARERLTAIGEVAVNDSAERDGWLEWLLRVVLGWGDLYRTGDEAAAVVREVPEYRTTLRADGVLRDRSGTLRAVVVTVPFRTRFDARLPGEEWSASPLDRVTELARAHGVAIALLSDGDRIALVNVPIARKDAPTETTGGYAVWQTALFAEGAEREYFAAFVALLHAQRFFNAGERETPEALFERSALTQADLTKTLGLQVREAVELMVGAFSRADRERRGELLDVLPPHVVYEAAATVMMRLVFMLYAEERDLLPIGDPTYAENYAVSTLRDQLDADAVRVGEEPLERRASAWRRLLATFNAIYSGIDHDRLRLPAYGGRLFDPSRFAFLEQCRVDDLTTRAVLTSLQTVKLAGESRRLSFLALDVEQIGHVYEGLLDHDAIRVEELYLGFDGKSGAESEIAFAELERVAAAGHGALVAYLAEKLDRSEKAIEKGLARGEKLVAGEEPETRRLVMTACESDEGLVRRVLPYAPLLRNDLQGLPTVYPAGAIVVTKTRARRDSGTEYTPRVLAEEIVRYALEPLVFSPGPVDGASRDTWQVRPSSELLALKICDPACGSGAFLVAACRYLAERVAEAWQREGYIADDDPVRDAQRIISERCLYGVDRDPMAVEMAKLSIWLLTFARQRPFGFLDHAIREGDSLLGITSLDQLRTLHFDPERGRALHDGTLFDITRRLAELVNDAVLFRRKLEDHVSLCIQDVEEKARLESLARAQTEASRLIADALSSVSIHYSASSVTARDSRIAELADGVSNIIANSRGPGVAVAELAAATQQMRVEIDRGKPLAAPARKPLHWPLEFPEVFSGDRPGFDLIISNPPFVPDAALKRTVGSDFRAFLVTCVARERTGRADLIGFFTLRLAELSRRVAVVATNSIAEGDTRAVSLDWLLNNRWHVDRATRRLKWPGSAKLVVSLIWMSRSEQKQVSFLDGHAIGGITSALLPKRINGDHAWRLNSNMSLFFNGSKLNASGFIIDLNEARAIIACDEQYKTVIRPFYSGKKICSDPMLMPDRAVVDFSTLTIEEAERRFPLALRIIEERVKPERQRRDLQGNFVLRAPLPQKWWQFGDVRPALYRLLARSTHAIVIPTTSKWMMPVRVGTGPTFAHSLNVAPSASWDLLGLVMSEIHRVWVRARGSTLETRPRYAPTDCFENFPFPGGVLHPVGQIADDLVRHRDSFMKGEQLGITDTYNLLHSNIPSSSEVDTLRRLHQDLDYEVLAAYGWDNIFLDHDFRDTDDGIRFAISNAASDDILDRLLALNHQRHAEEVAGSQTRLAARERMNRRGQRSSEVAATFLLERP